MQMAAAIEALPTRVVAHSEARPTLPRPNCLCPTPDPEPNSNPNPNVISKPNFHPHHAAQVTAEAVECSICLGDLTGAATRANPDRDPNPNPDPDPNPNPDPDPNPNPNPDPDPDPNPNQVARVAARGAQGSARCSARF